MCENRESIVIYILYFIFKKSSKSDFKIFPILECYAFHFLTHLTLIIIAIMFQKLILLSDPRLAKSPHAGEYSPSWRPTQTS